MEVVAKKQFGQNFLKDQSVLNRIIQSMPNNDNQVVEIGPGLGDLTDELLKLKDVKAYEVDRDLCPILEKKFHQHLEHNRFNLICSDVLAFWDEHKSLHDEPYDLVANLPYYISSTIVLRAFEDENCQNILVMTQLEVAQKFCATHTQKEHSSLSVMSELIGEARILFEVPASSFEPAPKVTSAVMLISKKDGIHLDAPLKRFLKMAFAQPRKTLAKNLSASYPKDAVIGLLATHGLSNSVRGHEVPSLVFYELYQQLK
jgi:16S rRNA (adenine1518-N6/adenine1519-N6)-dimethyltransferase